MRRNPNMSDKISEHLLIITPELNGNNRLQ